MTRLLALALFFPSAALAQTPMNAHGFDHTVSDNDVRDLLQTWRPEAQTPGSFGISLLGEFADSPLVLIQQRAGDQETIRLVDDLFGINTGLHVGLHERIAVAAGVPIFLSNASRNGNQGVGIGDAHLAVPIGLILPDEDDQGFGLSVIPTAYFPSGNAERFLGGEFAGAAVLAPAFGAGPFTFTGNFGVELNRTSLFLDPQPKNSPRLVSALGVSWAVTDMFGVGLEADFRPGLDQQEVVGTNSPGEGVLHVKGRYPFGMSWTLGGAAGFTRGESTAQFRIFAGLGWTFGKDGPRDKDGDGLIETDQCPVDAEIFNGYLDDDGCPDALADLAVTVVNPEGTPLEAAMLSQGGVDLGSTNSSGIANLTDLMPGEPIEIRSEHGSGFYVPTERSSEPLQEGPNAMRVNMLWAPGTIRVKTMTEDGAPIDASLRFEGPETWDDVLVGADGEEMLVLPPGDWTIFAIAPNYARERREVSLSPSENALTVIEFPLAQAVTMVTDSGVVILEPVLFDFDSAALRPRSRELLTEVANDIRTTPEIKLIEVQGHTSTVGSSSYNRDLSQRRMDSVVEYLVGQGVDSSALLPVGYGESCTAVTEATDDDRQKNRRVQFFILDPEPEDGVPCHAGVPGQLDTERFEYERQREAAGE